MGLINGFGYTNFHEVNLDYIIKLVRENAGLHLDISGNQLLLKTLDGNTVSSVTIHYAEEAGHADTATTATNATYATSASTATTATNATNASHALTADSATTAGTATTATTATTASTATEASHATTADTALLANRATVADSATYAESTGSVEHASKAFEAVSANGLRSRFTKGDGTTGDFTVPYAIMAAVDYLMRHYEEEGLKHGPIEVMFSPDEETGHGMDKVPLNILKADFAVTADGGDEGELECECFNAWVCTIRFTGKACHTGSAKSGGMVNAVTLASSFASNLPRDMAPETTENYEGFIAPMEISGSIESASVDMLLRSFNIEEIEKEKEIIKTEAEKVVEKFGGSFELTFKQQYLNMKEKLDQHPEIMERLEKAYTDTGVKIIKKPIRGGTDGSRLTELGIPTPNIFTGAHEFHSRNEWLSLNQCAKSADVLINLLTQKVK